MMVLINDKKKELDKVCITSKVEELYVFGSILSDDFHAESDIDFVVTLHSEDPIEYAENYFQLKFELESMFNRKIDLLELKAIKNKTFENLINQQKVLVYARRNQSVA